MPLLLGEKVGLAYHPQQAMQSMQTAAGKKIDEGICPLNAWRSVTPRSTKISFPLPSLSSQSPCSLAVGLETVAGRGGSDRAYRILGTTFVPRRVVDLEHCFAKFQDDSQRGSGESRRRNVRKKLVRMNFGILGRFSSDVCLTSVLLARWVPTRS
jgi:hypothetical protein